jgi:hypothetical protein
VGEDEVVPEPGRGRDVRQKKEVDREIYSVQRKKQINTVDEQVPRVVGDEEVVDLLGENDYARIQGSKPKKPPIAPAAPPSAGDHGSLRMSRTITTRTVAANSLGSQEAERRGGR